MSPDRVVPGCNGNGLPAMVYSKGKETVSPLRHMVELVGRTRLDEPSGGMAEPARKGGRRETEVVPCHSWPIYRWSGSTPSSVFAPPKIAASPTQQSMSLWVSTNLDPDLHVTARALVASLIEKRAHPWHIVRVAPTHDRPLLTLHTNATAMHCIDDCNTHMDASSTMVALPH